MILGDIIQQDYILSTSIKQRKYHRIIIIQKMEGVITQAMNKNDYMLLRQALLNVDVFAEIDELFHQPEELNSFYSSFQILFIDDHHILDIQSNNLYLFVTKGAFLFSKIIKQSKSRKKVVRKKTRKKTQLKVNHDFCSDKVQISEGTVENLENWFVESEKIHKFFIASHGPAVILVLKSSTLQQGISGKIKNYYSQKLKSISRFQVFRKISKNILQNHVHSFRFTKAIFNDYLYTPSKRKNDVFFLKKGQVQIQSNHRKIIVRSPALLGDGKVNPLESAKCMTDSCVAFSLKKQILEKIIKENNFEIEQRQILNESIIRSEYFQRSMTPQQMHYYENRSSFQSPQNKKLRNSGGVNPEKKLLLRRYFSNYLNEQYDEFYEKKTHLLKELGIQNEQPILYNMKTLTPKQPNYDEMKRRLRGARLKKIIDFKDKISKKNNSKSILEGSVNKDRKLVQITYDHRKCLIIKDKLKKKLKFDKLPTANFLM